MKEKKIASFRPLFFLFENNFNLKTTPEKRFIPSLFKLDSLAIFGKRLKDQIEV
jgi:hypothetical protein